MTRAIPVMKRFSTKMILLIVLVIILPMIFTSMSFFIVSSDTVRANVRHSTGQLARQAADSLTSILSSGQDISDIIYNNTSIQTAIMMKELPYEEMNDNNIYITSYLNNLAYSSTYVKLIYIVRSEGTSWGSGTFTPSRLAQYPLDKQEWLGETIARDGSLNWLPLQYDPLSSQGAQRMELVLPVTRVMKNFEDLSTIALLIVNIDGEALLNIISQIQLGRTGAFFVTDADGVVMISQDMSQVGKRIASEELYQSIVHEPYAEFEYKEDGQLYYGVKRMLDNGWLTVGTVPVHELTEPLDSLQRTILFSFLCFTVIGILIGMLLSTRILQPIKLLTKQMKRVEGGDLKVRTQVSSPDEIGDLSKQFNTMLDHIESLIEQVRMEQAQKQEAELRAVMHRINPHFLYNTLSTIRWLVKFQHHREADEAISTLIRLLELNMGKKGHFITIDEELDIVRTYIRILELRYNLKFELRITVHDQVRSFEIPRMLLQTLVENAVYHGFVPLELNGQINIILTKTSGTLEIVVSDNGMGMSQERLAEIRRAMNEDGQGVGIGLKHLVESVKLYYGPNSYINIFSREGAGTTFLIVLQLPVLAQEQMR